MAFPCPRCGDRYTQSLPMVYGSGTHVRNWRSRSGYRGSTFSQSIVGSMAAPPLKRSVFKPLFWLLILWIFLGGPISLTVHRLLTDTPQAGSAPVVTGSLHPSRRGRTQHSPVFTRKQSEQQVLVVAAVGAALTFLMLWRLVTALKFNRRDFPKLLIYWQSGFMCRGCGAIFHPHHPFALREG